MGSCSICSAASPTAPHDSPHAVFCWMLPNWKAAEEEIKDVFWIRMAV
jgi:hypothetical protein